MYRDNICKSYLVHRIVAETFLPNPNNLPTVNHKDGNKLNNRLDNLEWMTRSDNQQHAIKTGLLDKNKQSKAISKSNIVHKSKIVLQYTLEGEFLEEYCSASEAARINDCHSGPITNVCRGERKQAYGYIWKYR